MGIAKFLKPKPSEDPLRPSSGYGWGWLILLGIMGRALFSSEASEAFKDFYVFIFVPAVMVLYFFLRKGAIDKGTYSEKIWLASFVSGVLALIFGFVALLLASWAGIIRKIL